MYRVTRTIVKQNKHPELYQYLLENGMLATSLYNASLFRIRQNFTMHGKDVLHPLEQEVREEIQRTISVKHLGVPKRCMSYPFLEKLMRTTGNPDFFSKLPAHVTQHVLKQACADFRNWLKACRSYKKDPSKFLGHPKMPSYKKKKAPSSYTFSNQECYVTETERGSFLKFPLLRNYFLPIGKASGRLKQVEVKPYYGDFLVICVYETEDSVPKLENGASCGIDLGVDNIAALVSNNGYSVLYKGGALKARNQWFNKQMAYYRSEAMKGRTSTETAKLGLLNTKRMKNLSRKRNLFFHDAIHKIASDIVRFCIHAGITTIVIGKTKNWKQNANIGHKNNQNFVQIPLETLRFTITYKAEAVGIQVIEQEESYTSKASFVDGDAIPIYGEEHQEAPIFSGRRIHRGLYKTKTGRLINADLNGAANILRKHCPDAFLRIGAGILGYLYPR